jgi:CO/xanthine dehydrogenase FAD-binding subunit
MLSNFKYVRPTTLEEALQCLKTSKKVKVLAGGTDLMILLRRNLLDLEQVLDIKGIPEMKKLEYTPGEGLFIGACVTVNQVSKSKIVQKNYPALAQGADSLASYQLRNRATLVGNLCNASPGADLAPPLLLFKTAVHIAGPNGKREVSIHEFFTGVKKTVLQKDELVVGVKVAEVGEKDQSLYLKQARLKGHDLATVGVAIRLDSNNKVSIAMAAVAPTPIRLKELEEKLTEKPFNAETALWAEKQVPHYIKPISDIRSSADYRLHAASVLVKKGLMELFSKEAK